MYWCVVWYLLMVQKPPYRYDNTLLKLFTIPPLPKKIEITTLCSLSLGKKKKKQARNKWKMISGAVVTADTLLTIFLGLNITFLFGTAVWFRLDHASGGVRNGYCRRWQTFQANQNHLLSTSSSSSSSSSSGTDTNNNNTVGDHTRLLLTAQVEQDIMWQYSLRSNLLLFGCTLASYLLYIGENGFLLTCFVGFSILNVVTDVVYVYDEVPFFLKVQKGHQIASIVICSVAGLYFLFTVT